MSGSLFDSERLFWLVGWLVSFLIVSSVNAMPRSAMRADGEILALDSATLWCWFLHIELGSARTY